MNLFVILFYQPTLNLLIWIHNLIPGNDLGWSIIALTVVIKLILLPFSAKSLRSQKALQDIQPKIDEIRAKYKDDKQRLGQEMMAIYKQEKVSPFSSCLPLLIQLPFLLAIFQVLRDGLQNGSLDKLYGFVARPEAVDTVFLGIFQLQNASIPLAIAAGALQYWQTKMLMHKRQPSIPGAKDEGMTSIMNKQMMYLMPIITVFIGATLPGGLTLYWTANTVLTILQQYLVFRPSYAHTP